jgi:hypothetical protein
VYTNIHNVDSALELGITRASILFTTGKVQTITHIRNFTIGILATDEGWESQHRGKFSPSTENFLFPDSSARIPNLFSYLSIDLKNGSCQILVCIVWARAWEGPGYCPLLELELQVINWSSSKVNPLTLEVEIVSNPENIRNVLRNFKQYKVT